MPAHKSLKNFLWSVLKEVEGAGRDPYSVTRGSGRGGLSFGLMQNDVRTNPAAREVFRTVAGSLFSDPQLDRERATWIQARQGYTGDELRFGEDKYGAEEVAAINRALQNNKDLVDDLDRWQMSHVAGQVQSVFDKIKTSRSDWQGTALDDRYPDPRAVGLLAAWGNRVDDLKDTGHALAAKPEPPSLETLRDHLKRQLHWRKTPTESYDSWDRRVSDASRRAAYYLAPDEEGRPGSLSYGGPR